MYMPRLPRNLPISSISFPGSTVITTMASADFATGSNMPGNANVGSSMLDAAIPYIWSGMTIFVGLIAVLGGLLYAKQDSLLYYPEIGGIPRRPSQNPRRYRSPSEHQVPFEELMIRCEDGVRIHSWLMLRSENNSKDFPTIVFFHGNAGNIGLRLPNALQMLQYLDAHVLLVEYRGYGDSDDAPVKESGLKLDAEAALKFIRTHQKVDPNRIFIFGRSLGGSVAFHLANYAERNRIPIAGLMIENTFLSIAAMVDVLMPYLAPFKGLILRIGWNSRQLVPHLTVPILYLAGANDQLVPHEHMLELYKHSKSSRLLQMHIIPDGTHNESWLQGGPEYWQKMKEFMHQAELAEPASDTPLPSQTFGASVSPPHPTSQTESSNIPLMPKRFVGMMSEALSGGKDTDQTPAKKEN